MYLPFSNRIRIKIEPNELVEMKGGELLGREDHSSSLLESREGGGNSKHHFLFYENKH